MSEADDIRKRLEGIGTAGVERVETEALGTIYMRDISGDMRWLLWSVEEAIPKGTDGKKRYPPKLIIAVALCDANGDPLYDEFDKIVALVSKVPANHLDELYAHALRVTGLGAKSLEDAEKKYSSSQSSESGTTSPSPSEAAPHES